MSFLVASPTNYSDIYDCFSTTQKTVHCQTNSSPSKPFLRPASDLPSTPNPEASLPPSQPSVMPHLLFHRAPAPDPEVHSEASVWVAVAPSEAAVGARKVVDRSLVAWPLSLFNDIRPFDLRPGLAASLLLSLSILVDLSACAARVRFVSSFLRMEVSDRREV